MFIMFLVATGSNKNIESRIEREERILRDKES